MDNKVTKRTRARKKNRSRRKQKDEADVSQVLGMTPEKRSSEDLAAATAMQRARAAAEQYDRRASTTDAETMEEWHRKGETRESIVSHDSDFDPADPPVQWTPEEGYVDTDDEEEYSDDEKTNEVDEDFAVDEKAADASGEAAYQDAEVSEAEAIGAAAEAAEAIAAAAAPKHSYYSGDHVL